MKTLLKALLIVTILSFGNSYAQQGTYRLYQSAVDSLKKGTYGTNTSITWTGLNAKYQSVTVYVNTVNGGTGGYDTLLLDAYNIVTGEWAPVGAIAIQTNTASFWIVQIGSIVRGYKIVVNDLYALRIRYYSFINNSRTAVSIVGTTNN